MDTSGRGILNAVLYAVVLSLVLPVALHLPAARRGRVGRPGSAVPLAAVALWAVVAVPSLVQPAVPELYGALYRDPGLVLARHQWWRVVTAIVVQDGGVPGTAWNLAVLAPVAVLGVRARGARQAAGIFWGCGIALNLGALVVSPSGGGNSGATYALALSIAVLAWTTRLGRASELRTAGAVVAAAALVALRDLHGVAMLVGALVGVVLPPHRDRAATTSDGTA